MLNINKSRLLGWRFSPQKTHMGYTWKLMDKFPIQLAGFNSPMMMYMFAFFDKDGKHYKTQGIGADEGRANLDDLAVSLLEFVLEEQDDNWEEEDYSTGRHNP